MRGKKKKTKKKKQGLRNSNKEYNQKLHYFSGLTKNDVNLIKPIFGLHIPKINFSKV